MSYVAGWSRTAGAARRVLADAARQERIIRNGYDGFLSWVGNTSVSADKRDSLSSVLGQVRADNRAWLHEAFGSSASVASDIDLVRLAYAKWGKACPDRVLGDFAFAVADSRSRTLFLARDPLGVRPIYYAIVSGVLFFSPQISLLSSVPGAGDELNQDALTDYLADLPCDDTVTAFSRIRRLGPGHCLVFDGENLEISRYFDLERVRPRELSGDGEYAEALRAELRRAVACRLPNNERCGALLSGGLDSSMLTVLASQHLRRVGAERLWSISADFGDILECSEGEYQNLVVHSENTSHLVVHPEPAGPSGDLSGLLDVFGEPAPIGGHWLAWSAAEAAAKVGVRYLVTGVDGDRVVSHGDGVFRELAGNSWISLFKECSAIAGSSRPRQLRVAVSNLVQSAIPPRILRVLDQCDPRRLRGRVKVLGFLRGERVRRHTVMLRLGALRPRPSTTREGHLARLQSADRAVDTELLDALGQAMGVEFVHPFYDRRVVELCFSFPAEQKRRNGRSRVVLRNAMLGITPEAVANRPGKANFTPAVIRWQRNCLRRWIQENAADFTGLEPYARVPDVVRLAERFRTDPATPHVDFLWRCVVASEFIRRPARSFRAFGPGYPRAVF